MLIPIAITQPNWHLFVKTSLQVLGYSPTRCLDKKGMTVGNSQSLLIALDSFKDQGFDPNTESKNMNHIYISFMMTLTEELYITLLETFNLSITRSNEYKTKNEVCIIATSNLFVWKTICVCINNSHEERLFSYGLYEQLKVLGYNIFNDYKVEEILDGSKILLRR
jgi:hypothetical protein